MRSAVGRDANEEDVENGILILRCYIALGELIVMRYSTLRKISLKGNKAVNKVTCRGHGVVQDISQQSCHFNYHFKQPETQF